MNTGPTDDSENEPLLTDVLQPTRDNHFSREEIFGASLLSTSFSTNNSVDDEEDRIRKKLQWFFKNPYEKYTEKGRKPWKLVLQVIKIILVTVQATWFATDEFSVVQFNTDNIETFKQFYIKDYKDGEIQDIYTKNQLYNHIFHVWKQYYTFEKAVVGSYVIPTYKNGTSHPLQYCKTINQKAYQRMRHKEQLYLGENDEVCYPLLAPDNSHNGTALNTTSLETFVKENRLPRAFDWIETLTLAFSVQSVSIKEHHATDSPDCYTFVITIVFDNADLDGKMSMDLKSTVNFNRCRKYSIIGIEEHDKKKIVMTVFDSVVVILCFTSLVLCLRSMTKHLRLCRKTAKFFTNYRHEKFTLSDKLNFVSFWICLMLLSDVCTIFGTVIKIVLDWLEYPSLYSPCSLGFGLAVLFSWTGVLRYLGFLQGFNTLIVTLKTAFPTVMRFIFCAAFIYMGFLFCGWIVFGPYNEKFRTLSVTSECLFALINGDDMYNTFLLVDDSSELIWYFSRFYLYCFISLFIFVVLSLFIGIIGDTYERIKDYGHAPKTRVELFMEGIEYTANQEHERMPSCSHVENNINDTRPISPELPSSGSDIF